LKDGHIIVHDAIHNGVKDSARTQPQEILARFQRLPQLLQPARLSMPHGNEKVRPYEEEDLAELNDLLGIDVAGRLEHQKKRIAVPFELGPLVRFNRVFHGQLVEIELASNALELVRSRFIEAEPHERAVIAARPGCCLGRVCTGAAVPVFVDPAVDDHGLNPSAMAFLRIGGWPLVFFRASSSCGTLLAQLTASGKTRQSQISRLRVPA
jgi:hypothetical protein